MELEKYLEELTLNNHKSNPEKISSVKDNLEIKLKYRMNFLKEKIFRNIEEVKKIAKILLQNKMHYRLDKPKKYFNILKNKKGRETDSLLETDTKEIPFKIPVNESENLLENYNYEKKKNMNFRSFFNSSFNSIESENEIEEYDMENNNTNDFEKAFQTKFVSLNNYKEDINEDSNEFFDLNNNYKSKDDQNENSKSFKNLTDKSINHSDIDIHDREIVNENAIFQDDEIKQFNEALCEIKQLNNYSLDKNPKIDYENEVLKKKKYNILNAEDKKRIIEIAQNSDIKEVSRKFKIPLKSLKRWMSLGYERKKGGGRKEKDPEMEIQLYKWVLDFQNKNQIITSKMIKQKALELSQFNDFLASKDWLNKFKRKFNIEVTREAEISKIKNK